MASRVFSRIARAGATAPRRPLLRSSTRLEPLMNLSSDFHPLSNSAATSQIKWAPYQVNQLLSRAKLTNVILQRFGFSSTASPQSTDKEVNNNDNASEDASSIGINTDSAKTNEDSSTPEEAPVADAELDLSFDDLVKLVAEKEELLKLKHKEIEIMQDKVLRSYAEMENVIERTKREAGNSKKFAIQNFAKSLLDVADNLGRASSVVKVSFAKIDPSKDSIGAVPLIKTMLEGVEMTEKQLAEIFRKFGVEKFDPLNEQFDPNRHHALFQIPDASKPSGTVAAVLKPGYMLHDRILRPAEVGVTESSNEESAPSSDA